MSPFKPVFKLQKRAVKRKNDEKQKCVKRRKGTLSVQKYEIDEDYKALNNAIFRVEKTIPYRSLRSSSNNPTP